MVCNRDFDCVLSTESQAPCQLTRCLGFTSVFAATFVLCSNAGRYYCSSSTGNWVRLRSANPAFVRSRTRMSQIAKRQDLGRVKKRCRGHRLQHNCATRAWLPASMPCSSETKSLQNINLCEVVETQHVRAVRGEDQGMLEEELVLSAASVATSDKDRRASRKRT